MSNLRFIQNMGRTLLILSAVLLCNPQAAQAEWELLATEWEIEANRGTVWAFDGTTGTLKGPFTEERGIDAQIQTLAFGADGNLYVAQFQSGVGRFDGTTGAFIDQFIPAGSGGLDGADQLVFKDGLLYVSSRFSSQVLRYDAATGAFVDIFVSDSQLNGFIKFTFGPDGNIYAGAFNGQQEIYRYNGTTGQLIDTFSKNHPVIDAAYAGLTFGPDGNLYAARYQAGLIERYNGATGEYMGTFASFGNGVPPPYTRPVADALAFGPDGNLYVSTASEETPAAILKIDSDTGAVLGTFAQSPHANSYISGLLFRELPPSGYVFSGFFPRASIHLGPKSHDDAFKVSAKFGLGAESNGIDPVAENVGITFGNFSTTIPAGKFQQQGSELFTFEDSINNVNLKAQIHKPHAGSVGGWFKLQAKHADLDGTVLPIAVQLTIGDDTGRATLNGGQAQFGQGKDDEQWLSVNND